MGGNKCDSSKGRKSRIKLQNCKHNTYWSLIISLGTKKTERAVAVLALRQGGRVSPCHRVQRLAIILCGSIVVPVFWARTQGHFLHIHVQKDENPRAIRFIKLSFTTSKAMLSDHFLNVESEMLFFSRIY